MKMKNVKKEKKTFSDKFRDQGLTPDQQKKLKGGSFINIEEIDGA